METDGRHLEPRSALAFLIEMVGKGRIALLLGLMVLSSLTEGIGLLLLVPITQLVAAENAQVSGPDWLQPFADVPLELLMFGLVGLVAMRAGIVYFTNETQREIGLGLARKLRVRAHRAVLGADWRWLSGQNSADHAGIIMGESERVTGMVDSALKILAASVTLAILFLSAMLVSASVTLAITLCGALIAVPLMAMRARKDRDASAYSDAYLQLQRLVSNGLNHLRAARIANAAETLDHDFTEAAERMKVLEMEFFRRSHLTLMLFQILAALALVLFVNFALFSWQVPLAVLIPILAIAARSLPLVAAIQQGLRSWRYANPALARVTALIEEARAHDEPTDMAVRPVAFTRSIELRDIHLDFGGRGGPVFDGFNLELEAGAILGVTGPSGSGKSSLADILSGLSRPDSGQMLVDGQALEPRQAARWRTQTAYVEQAPFFFDGTIAQNLAWGIEGVDEAVMKAALERASAGFVEQLPQGLDTHVGEGGRQLSGGEKQRIALARALIRKPDLLILDEVTSALDRRNSTAIQQSVAALRGTVTTVILSHDEALLSLADTVIDLGELARRRSADA